MLELLPEEICWNIFYYLDVKSLCVASQVNKTWNRVLSSKLFTLLMHLGVASFQT